MSTKAKTIQLADVARQLKINPKVARQRLRRNFDNLRELVGYQPKEGAPTWEFPASCKSKLVKYLRNAA